MRTLEFEKHLRARVWIGELPDAAYPSGKSFCRAIAAGRESQNGLRLAAVEVLVPLGPRSMYGLLGGEWKPTTTGQFSVDVHISSANERLFADSLAMNVDDVRVGLPG
jgi:hypothetical protein